MLDFNKILYTIYRNPLLKHVSKSDIYDDVLTLVKLLGIPATFETKTITEKVKEFRAPLPKNIHNLIAVNSYKRNGNFTTRLKPSSDDRGLKNTKRSKQSTTIATYKQVPGFLYFDFKEGEVEITYKGFMVDNAGFPLLPDSASLLLAIVNYVKVNYFTVLVETNMLAGATLEKAEQQYNWYAGQVSNEFGTPSEEEAEVLIDSIARLLPDRNAYFTNFKFNGNTEIIKDHD
jgi:hypothetical protein